MGRGAIQESLRLVRGLARTEGRKVRVALSAERVNFMIKGRGCRGQLVRCTVEEEKVSREAELYVTVPNETKQTDSSLIYLPQQATTHFPNLAYALRSDSHDYRPRIVKLKIVNGGCPPIPNRGTHCGAADSDSTSQNQLMGLRTCNLRASPGFWVREDGICCQTTSNQRIGP